MKYANITEKPEDIKLRLLDFMEKSVYPNEHNYNGYLKNAKDRFSAVPLVEELKTKAKEQGLWNLFVPKQFGGLSNFDYASLAEIRAECFGARKFLIVMRQTLEIWKCL